MDRFELRYALTDEEYRAASRLGRVVMRAALVLLPPLLLGAWLLYLGLGLFAEGEFEWAAALWVPGLVLVIAIPLGLLAAAWSGRRRVQQQIRAGQAYVGPVTLRAGPRGLRTTTLQGDSHTPWRLVQGVSRSSRHLLLDLGLGQSLPIPLAAFEDEAAITAFTEAVGRWRASEEADEDGGEEAAADEDVGEAAKGAGEGQVAFPEGFGARVYPLHLHEDDLVAFNAHLGLARMQRDLPSMRALLALAVPLAGVSLLLLCFSPWFATVGLLAILVLTPHLALRSPALWRAIARRRVRRARRRHPEAFFDEATLGVGPKGVVLLTGTGRLQKTWSSFHEVVVTDDHLFLLDRPGGGFVLPRRALGDDPEQDIAQIWRWCREAPRDVPTAPRAEAADPDNPFASPRS